MPRLADQRSVTAVTEHLRLRTAAGTWCSRTRPVPRRTTSPRVGGGARRGRASGGIPGALTDYAVWPGGCPGARALRVEEAMPPVGVKIGRVTGLSQRAAAANRSAMAAGTALSAGWQHAPEACGAPVRGPISCAARRQEGIRPGCARWWCVVPGCALTRRAVGDPAGRDEAGHRRLTWRRRAACHGGRGHPGKGRPGRKRRPGRLTRTPWIDSVGDLGGEVNGRGFAKTSTEGCRAGPGRSGRRSVAAVRGFLSRRVGDRSRRRRASDHG